MQRWKSLQVSKTFKSEKRSFYYVKVRHLYFIQTIHPSIKIFSLLTPLSFPFPAAGAEGDITWKKDGEDIEDEDIVQKVDEGSSKVVIKQAGLDDAGKYTCACQFDSGHDDAISTTLFVHGK